MLAVYLETPFKSHYKSASHVKKRSKRQAVRIGISIECSALIECENGAVSGADAEAQMPKRSRLRWMDKHRKKDYSLYSELVHFH